eukprot:4592712-Pyramimonas_sp.AAC.1
MAKHDQALGRTFEREPQLGCAQTVVSRGVDWGVAWNRRPLSEDRLGLGHGPSLRGEPTGTPARN